MTTPKLDIETVAKVIGDPTKMWPGNCYGIAKLLVQYKLVRGTAIYGHWTGPIHRLSPFANRRNVGFTQHGWVLHDDGKTVVDPTRWVFEHVKPYIFVGKPTENECIDFAPDDPLSPVCICGHVTDEHSHGFFRRCDVCHWPYDEGGNELAEMRRGPPPAYDQHEKTVALGRLPPETRRWLRQQLGGQREQLTWSQAFWLANLPCDFLGEHVHAIYRALKKSGHAALIPIDNQSRSDREEAVSNADR